MQSKTYKYLSMKRNFLDAKTFVDVLQFIGRFK